MGLFLTHLASALFMTGLIWFVQIVHYPLFAQVGSEAYPAYQTAHMRRTTVVVGPPMLLELATAAALVSGAGPDWLDSRWAWANLALLGVIWLSTALLQSPAHAKLTAGFQATPHLLLVRSNWLRTALWSGRSLILLTLLARRI